MVSSGKEEEPDCLEEENSSIYINEANGPIHITKANNTIHINRANGPIHLNRSAGPTRMDGRNDSEEYGNPLEEASAGGHEQIVKLLLDKGADPNAQGGHYGNALQAASAGDHKRVVRPQIAQSYYISSGGPKPVSPRASDLPARPETPPRPCCAIPFRRDADFVDRGVLLDQIREKNLCTSIADGTGGLGWKSQLAIEHCYRTAEQSPETWVFWVHASNPARLEQSFRDIADRVKLIGRKDPQADVFKLVHDWLRDERHGKWLLVLDNADSATVLSPPSDGRKAQGYSRDGALRQHLLRYLPPSRYGSVLATSRTKQAVSQLVEDSDMIHIGPMDNAGAQTLLETKLGDNVNKDGIAELAAALEYMPLAFVQAAAYIQRRAPRCSVRQYVEEFCRSDRKKTSLLEYEAGQLHRDEEASHSIITTWQISFDHIRNTTKSAADLLSLMSLFDRQDIPEVILQGYNDQQTGKSWRCT